MARIGVRLRSLDRSLDGGGEPLRHVPEKPSTGCSSIAFGATPDWPCQKSKKPTPVIVAVPRSRLTPLCKGEQARINAERADCIRRRNAGFAVSVQ
jgi:hypothetical protein